MSNDNLDDFDEKACMRQLRDSENSDLTKNVAKDVAEDVAEDVTENVAEDIAKNIAEDVAENEDSNNLTLKDNDDDDL